MHALTPDPLSALQKEGFNLLNANNFPLFTGPSVKK
jgi:hypothetical protein